MSARVRVEGCVLREDHAEGVRHFGDVTGKAHSNHEVQDTLEKLVHAERSCTHVSVTSTLQRLKDKASV